MIITLRKESDKCDISSTLSGGNENDKQKTTYKNDCMDWHGVCRNMWMFIWK